MLSAALLETANARTTDSVIAEIESAMVRL
jgi:hypothetical protein